MLNTKHKKAPKDWVKLLQYFFYVGEINLSVVRSSLSFCLCLCLSVYLSFFLSVSLSSLIFFWLKIYRNWAFLRIANFRCIFEAWKDWTSSITIDQSINSIDCNMFFFVTDKTVHIRPRYFSFKEVSISFYLWNW